MEIHKKYSSNTVMQANKSESFQPVKNIAKSIINSILMQAVKELPKGHSTDGRKPYHDQIVASVFPNTKRAGREKPSLLQLAAEFVDSILHDSLDKARGIKEDQKLRAWKQLFCNTEIAETGDPVVFDLANDFVDNILDESRKRATNLQLLEIERFKRYNSPDDFRIKDGLEIIARCINKWSFNRNWYFKITYDGRMLTDKHFYFYTVKWSVPSLGYPVAQVTVDIYFTVEVIPKTPPPVHIEVWYSLESDRSQRSALNSNFMEKWLNNIVAQKLKAFRQFTF